MAETVNQRHGGAYKVLQHPMFGVIVCIDSGRERQHVGGGHKGWSKIMARYTA